MLNKILDSIFPPKCAFCGEIINQKIPVCESCIKKLPFTDDYTCKICGRPLGEFSYPECAACRQEKRHFVYSFVPLVYEDFSKMAVIRLKHSNHPYYSRALAYLIADKMLSSPYYKHFDFITCIPQNSRTHHKRGYNQSELIAKELAKLLKVPFIKTLHRNNEGARQATLNRVERKKNVRKCYTKTDKTFNGETVLLVDDVYTTGETANYCAKLLKSMGAKDVYLAVSMIRSYD